MTWTSDKLAEMTKLRGEGLSASEVAEKLGTTRNAVLGKEFRARQGPSSRKRLGRCVARGEPQGRQLKVAIGFAPEVHARIAAQAVQRGTSFAVVARELIDVGLSVEEWSE